VLGLDVGASGYYGGASAGRPELAGVRVGIAEVDARYRSLGFDLRAEYAYLVVVNSWKVNDYLGVTGAADVAARGRGYYLQAGYDLLRLLAPETTQELVVFAGYENVNPRSSMSPYNANPPSITPVNQPVPNAPSQPKSFLRAGLSYRPHPFVAFKLDAQIALGEQAAAPATAVLPGAPGMPRPLDADVLEAARGESRVGLGVAFMF
jgi:hypothetical protein